MEIIPKQKLYKSAYCSMFECYVRITHAYQVEDGNGNHRWLFYAENFEQGIKPNTIFSEFELSFFCL